MTERVLSVGVASLAADGGFRLARFEVRPAEPVAYDGPCHLLTLDFGDGPPFERALTWHEIRGLQALLGEAT